MGVSRFEDLDVWQLAHAIEEEVFTFTATGPASRDFAYRDQIRDSARSAPSNIAEGFGRYYPKEFLRFLRIACGSLNETKNHLHEGLDRRYLEASRHQALVRLALRAIKANERLQTYLESCKTFPPRRA